MGLPGGREGQLAYDGVKQRDSPATASSIGTTPERFEMPSGAASSQSDEAAEKGVLGPMPVTL